MSWEQRSWEQRNHDFSTAQVDAQMAYIEAEREVVRLQAENAKLRELAEDIADHIKHDDGFGIDCGWVLDRMRELGIEVDG